MDRLQTIEVFVAVAEEGGFARAARRLSMSPPAVTRAVSQLEARLGCRLLHRTTRSLRLSEAGQRYLVDCRRILAEIEEAERHAAGIHAAPRGMVSVTASVMFGRIVLAPVLHDLLDRYPEIAVSAVFVDRVVHLMNEGIDVAVRIAELPDSTLSASRIGSVRRVLCASPDYIAARGQPRAPADLGSGNHGVVEMHLGRVHHEKRQPLMLGLADGFPARVNVGIADREIFEVGIGIGEAHDFCPFLFPLPASGP